MFGAPSFLRHGSSAARTISSVLGGGFHLTKTGSYVLTLSGANTYTGPTTIMSGELRMTGGLTDGGVASPIGASTSDASNLVFGGGGLAFINPTFSTNRAFTVLQNTSGSFMYFQNATGRFTGGSAATNGSMILSGVSGFIYMDGNFQHTGNYTQNSLTISGVGSVSGAFTNSGTLVYYAGGGGPGTSGTLTVASVFLSPMALRVYSDGVGLTKIVSGAVTGSGGFTVHLMQAMPAGLFTLIECTTTLPAGTPVIGTNSSGRTPTFSRVPGVGFQVSLV